MVDRSHTPNDARARALEELLARIFDAEALLANGGYTYREAWGMALRQAKRIASLDASVGLTDKAVQDFTLRLPRDAASLVAKERDGESDGGTQGTEGDGK